MRRAALLLVPLFLFACDREPVSPDIAPTFAASSEWVRGTVSLSNLMYVDCLGEYVLGSGEAEYSIHFVESASGNGGWTWRFLPTTPFGPQFTNVGQTTGRVFWYDHGLPTNILFHGGPGTVSTTIQHEAYRADNGDRLFFDGRWQMTVNANGELAVSREYFAARCERGR